MYSLCSENRGLDGWVGAIDKFSLAYISYYRYKTVNIMYIK